MILSFIIVLICIPVTFLAVNSCVNSWTNCLNSWSLSSVSMYKTSHNYSEKRIVCFTITPCSHFDKIFTFTRDSVTFWGMMILSSQLPLYTLTTGCVYHPAQCRMERDKSGPRPGTSKSKPQVKITKLKFSVWWVSQLVFIEVLDTSFEKNFLMKSYYLAEEEILFVFDQLEYTDSKYILGAVLGVEVQI